MVLLAGGLFLMSEVLLYSVPKCVGRQAGGDFTGDRQGHFLGRQRTEHQESKSPDLHTLNHQRKQGAVSLATDCWFGDWGLRDWGSGNEGWGVLRASARLPSSPILYEKSFNLKTISQGDFGHFRENNLIILSKVDKIALKIF